MKFNKLSENNQLLFRNISQNVTNAREGAVVKA